MIAGTGRDKGAGRTKTSPSLPYILVFPHILKLASLSSFQMNHTAQPQSECRTLADIFPTWTGEFNLLSPVSPGSPTQCVEAGGEHTHWLWLWLWLWSCTALTHVILQSSPVQWNYKEEELQASITSYH